MTQPASASADPGGAAWYKRLREQRERRGLNRHQVAEDLHVDEQTIAALEAGRFTSLGAPVFARGHLRKYATVLGLNAEELLAEFELDSEQPPELVPLTPSAPRLRPEVPVKWLGAATVAAMVLGVGWWALTQPQAPMVKQDAVLTTITARITALDQTTREVTLKGPLGNTVTFTVDKRVTRLNEMKVGDDVTADYYVAYAAEFRAPTEQEKANPFVVLEEKAKAPAGTSPAAGALKITRAVVTIEGLDRPTKSMTLSSCDMHTKMRATTSIFAGSRPAFSAPARAAATTLGTSVALSQLMITPSAVAPAISSMFLRSAAM